MTCLKIDTRVALGPSRGDGDMINEVTLPALHHHHTALHCSLFAPLHTHDIGPHCAHYLPSNGVPIPDVSGGACDDEGWVWLLWVPATGAVVAGAVVGVVRWCGVVVLWCCVVAMGGTPVVVVSFCSRRFRFWIAPSLT